MEAYPNLKPWKPGQSGNVSSRGLLIIRSMSLFLNLSSRHGQCRKWTGDSFTIRSAWGALVKPQLMPIRIDRGLVASLVEQSSFFVPVKSLLRLVKAYAPV